MNLFTRVKRALLMSDIKERVTNLETKVYRKPDLIGFERVECDPSVEVWDNTGEVWPVHWEEDRAKKEQS